MDGTRAQLAQRINFPPSYMLHYQCVYDSGLLKQLVLPVAPGDRLCEETRGIHDPLQR